MLSINPAVAKLGICQTRFQAGGPRTGIGGSEWSYDLLSEAQQTMLRGLGVFAGSFTLEAAAAVVTGAPVAQSDAFDALAGLVDKSLVVSLAGMGDNRYRLLDAGVRTGEADGWPLWRAGASAVRAHGERVRAGGSNLAYDSHGRLARLV
jgi:hypothetical protein